MVYIAPDGTVRQNAPWSIQKIIDIFWAIIAFIIFFFQSLVGLDSNSGRNRSNRGGGGGGNGSGGGPKRIGRITTIEDCSMPGGG